ncbi:MAG TPA: hypothetical protein ENJ41_08495, partial [Oceanospirillales bacterium]|nr:hypothetical protein [Oceanospirillales bacterium]
MKKSRRKFLRDSLLLSSAAAISGSAGASLLPTQKMGNSKDIFICVFQRGAADGLHSVVPHAESAYF